MTLSERNPSESLYGIEPRSENDWFFLRQSAKLLTRVVVPERPPPLALAIQTNRPGSRKGSGRKSNALTTLKMAVFAPIPSAS
jgi:hypothetical protein